MKRLIIIIFILALVLRVIYVLSLPVEFISKWESDAGVYKKLAVNLLNTHTYGRIAGVPDAQDPPVYPFFLALIYMIFGSGKLSIVVVRLIQALLGSFVCVIIFFIAKEIFDKKVAILSSLLVALHPALIAYTGMHLTETLYIFLLSLFVLYMLKSYFDLSIINTFLSGLLLGIGFLNREVLLLFPFFIVGGLFILGYKFRQVVKYAAIILVGMTVIIGPWTMRNFIKFHKFIPVTKGGGQVIYASNYIPEGEKWRAGGEIVDRVYKEIRDDNQTSHTKKALGYIVYLMKNRPLSYLDMLAKKFHELWLHPSGSKQIQNKYLRSTYLAIHYILLLFCFLGIGVSIKYKNKKILPLLLILVYVTFLFVFILFPLARYFLPFLPYVFIFSVQGFLRLLNVLPGYRKIFSEV